MSVNASKHSFDLFQEQLRSCFPTCVVWLAVTPLTLLNAPLEKHKTKNNNGLTFEDTGVSSKYGLHSCSVAMLPVGEDCGVWHVVGRNERRPYSSSVSVGCLCGSERAFNQRGEEPRASGREPGNQLVVRPGEWRRRT